MRSDEERTIYGFVRKRRSCYVEGKGMTTQGRDKNMIINDNLCNVQELVALFKYMRYLKGFVAKCWRYREAGGSNGRC